MHEIALVNAVAQTFIAEHDGQPVSAVVLAIGPKVERGVASTAWEAMVAGTSIETAALDFIDVLDELQCLECARKYPGQRLTQCPHCGGTGLVIGEAEEVSLASWTA